VVKEINPKSDLETQRMRYAFWLAVVGLLLAVTLVLFLYFRGMTASNDIVAVVGVFTGVTGTLVGAFFGVQIGSAGREEERTERRNAEMMVKWALATMPPEDARQLMQEMGAQSIE
jgi:hypothetical protein